MKTKFKSKLLGVLLVLVMVLSIAPLTLITGSATDGAASYSGVRPESAVAGDLTLTVDGDGVLTWTDLPGATSYDLNIYMKGGLVKSETGLTSPSYELEAMLDGYKKDSGTVTVNINVWGGSGRGGSANFLYSSPYPKLEAPTNLRWDVNGNPDWDDVANADGYTIYLYQPSGGAFNHYDLGNTSYFACTNYPEVATRVSDGWYFTVRATSTEGYRPSEYNESYRRGHIVGSGLRAESQQIFTVNENGTLLWNSVPGATSYDLSIWTKDGLFMAENGLTQCSYSLQEKLNAYKKDSGTIMVSLSPKGSNVSSHGGTEYFMYSSPYGKLEAPANLYWNGNMAGWSAVEGAESYTVYLYQPSGSGYNHWTTTDTYFDFSSVATIGEDWFFAVKATASDARDSVYNESPRYTGPVSTTLYTIGAYAYDGTNGVMDSGGQVYLETNAGVVDWTSAGETCPAVEGTAVTVKAAPTPGYVFVEWRQGTQGATISREAEYSFTATGDKFLYAIFRDKDDNEIAEVVGKIASDRIPRAGMEVSHFMPDIPDGEPYSRIWNGSEWRDENGVLISANIGHHYDRGYEFEAGRSYTTDYFYFEANSGYTFAENATVHLMGPERSMWDYEVTGFNNDRTIMYVRFTFRIPGDRDYADINKVSMVYYGTPKDGAAQPDAAKLIYNNCAITREEWNTGSWGSACTWDTSTGENRFKSGNTYVHMLELTALPGYKFSEKLLAQKGMQGEEEYGVVSLSDDRTVATVTYTYNVSDLEAINTVTLDTKAGNEDFYLIRGGDNSTSGLPFTTSYTQQNAPYEIRFSNYYKWYDVETEKEIDSIASIDLEVGKKYRLEFELVIKDEYETACRFADSPTLVLNDYEQAHASFVDIETEAHSSGTHLKVYITYTVQPKPGEGSGSYYPMVCYSYEEFKYAMENDDIRYVALGNVDDVITKVEGDGLIPAISVNGIKNLNVIGNATFTAPASGDGYKTVCALLHCEQGSTLNLSGAGKLTFKAVTNASYNAVVWNQGGSVYVDGATLIGSYNTAVYGKAIWQSYGELRISDGQFFAENALEPGKLPGAHTAVYIDGGQAWIQGGTFRTDNVIDTIDLPYGLDIGQYATVDLSGGTFYGILLPTSSTPLANYMDEETYTPLSDGSWFNPESEYSQNYTASGKVVRIAWLIDHVDVHINAPIAGVDISENYFNIPTSGCKVTMYYPQWYKNGESVPFGTFEAGASYKVVVWVDAKADYGAEFSNGVTVAINNQSVAVDRKSSHLIAVEYDFGECPNIVPQVDLTITAPKEGNTPSYTIGCGSDAYYAVGGSGNYTEFRKWYMSSDNDDWWEINGSHQFMSGYYYKLVVDIRTNNGYEFPLIDMGTIQPDVTATVNGYYANVYKAYEQDPSRYITVEYNFGECSDSIVERITVENVTAPVAGQKPNYNWSIRGTGYQMDAGRNNETYAVKNGMQWLDVTGGNVNYVFENDTFIPGHEYQCIVYVVAENGFEFLIDLYTNPETWPTATVNGYTAEINRDWTNANEARVYYTFTCGQPKVDTVILYDLESPQGGKLPDTSVTSAYPELYEITDVDWLDEEGGKVSEFEQGRMYTVVITVAAKKYNGVDGSLFADTVKAYIDGTEVAGWYNTVTVNNDNTVTLRYQFRKPASAPIVVPYMFTTQPAGNTVKVDENVNVNWQITFNATKTEIQQWNGSAWVVFNDTVQTLNGAGQYLFTSDTAKSIRLRIVAYIGNDAVATSNEFVIVWEEDAQEVTYYYYPGEASGSADFDIVASGTQITLADCMFEAPEGKHFKAWAIGSINGEQKQPGDKITITAETYIYAVWENIPITNYTINATAGANGSISPSGDTTVAQGANQTYTITANNGYHIKDVKVNGASVGVVATYTFTNVTANATITVEFEVDTVPHVCNPTLVPEKAADCTTAGKLSYYRCECGKYYEDAEGDIEIENIETFGIIEALGHKDADANGKCDVCGFGESVNSNLQAFKDAVANLSPAASAEQKYAELSAALALYAKLTDAEKAEAAASFASLQQAIAAYNEKAQSANRSLADASELALAPIAASFGFLALLWFALKKKFMM